MTPHLLPGSITIDRAGYRRERNRAWWWRTGISGVGIAIITWAPEITSLSSALNVAPGIPYLLAGILIGAVGSKRPGDIDQRFLLNHFETKPRNEN